MKTPTIDQREDAVIVDTGSDPTWRIIWLHGLGADGFDFVPLVGDLIKPEWPAIRFEFPHAPKLPVTINGGMRMRAWYDISSFDVKGRQDSPGVQASRDAISQRVRATRSIPPQRTIIAGFSQGGAIALATGLTFDERLAGLIVLSAYVPIAGELSAQLSSANRTVPIFMAHGSDDQVVPLALGEESHAWLINAGYDVAWHRYPMAHNVIAEELLDMAVWLESRWAG